MLSFSHTNQFLTGFQGNIIRSTRNSYRKSASVGIICEQSLQETVRNISCLSAPEIQVLAEKSVTEFNKFFHSNNIKQVPSLEKNIGIAYRLLHQNATKNSGGFLSSSFLRQKPSPMLLTSRGFKTKRSDSNTDKPFTKMNNNSEGKTEDPNINEVLKHLDISAKEKEKINIALVSYAAGVARNSDGLGLGKSAAGDKNKGFDWAKVRNLKNSLVVLGLSLAIFFYVYTRLGIRFLPGQGRNEISPEDIEITFDDVKGADEAKKELQEVVDFLKYPEKFINLGGKLPKGCLLVGPPGTGKTLLAKAVAGEAGVPFFHASGSEFDEILVGQGAKRIRELFKAAKAKAPCVIFIDEIDSVAAKRTSSNIHPYANQTVNQLLSEMDGFMSNEGVIVLGATNRAEELDKAMLRPGRFDSQVEVPKPDLKGRTEILQLYLSKIKHDNSVDLEKLARLTVGFSGADLFNMVNTAAIRAAVDSKEFVSMAEFDYSHDKHTMGTDWKSRVRDKADLEITAYHEAGHTLVAYFTPDAAPLYKVTIVAKGQSGGHTAMLPEGDMWHETKAQMLASMDVSMGGRAAEELIFGKDKITGGASSDLHQATKISEAMVKHLGMSEKIGLRVVQRDEMAPGSVELMDVEINKTLNESYKRAQNILKTHRRELDMLAEGLLHFETLDFDDIKTIIENKRPPSKQFPAASAIKLSSKTPVSPADVSGMPVPGVSPAGPVGGEIVG